jgi:hypothetical protein
MLHETEKFVFTRQHRKLSQTLRKTSIKVNLSKNKTPQFMNDMDDNIKKQLKSEKANRKL